MVINTNHAIIWTNGKSTTSTELVKIMSNNVTKVVKFVYIFDKQIFAVATDDIMLLTSYNILVQNLKSTVY